MNQNVWLCELNKTMQMMTNWPTAEIMLMGSWEKMVVGVGEDTNTAECQQEMILHLQERATPRRQREVRPR